MTPISTAPSCERALQLVLVVHLDERVHVLILGGLHQVGREVVLGQREDHEDGVGAVDPRLGDLPDVDHEVLAEHRHVDRGAHGREVGVAAAEVALRGQHRDRGGAGRGVVPGDDAGIGVGRDLALRRATSA